MHAASSVVDDSWQDGAALHDAALAFDLAPAGAKVRIRPMEARDLDEAASIAFSAFNTFNESVGQAPEFPPREVVDVPKYLYSSGLERQGFDVFVAVDEEGTVVGANMLEYQDGIGGIGPIASKCPGAGKLLMQAVMKAAAEHGVRAVRLNAVIANTRSFSLYLGLGFEPRRTCIEYVGCCTAEAPAGFVVKPLAASDVDECSALHEQVCASRRMGDIASAVGGPHPNAVARDEAGKVVGYTTGSYLSGHTVALSEEALQALVVAQSAAIAAAQAAGAPIPPPTLFVPHQHSGFARWLARNGFLLTRQIASMSYGPLAEPAGFYLPSIQY